jgi:predicted transcriptional regulator
MGTRSRPPEISLPKGWGASVKSAVIHVIALAQYVQSATRDLIERVFGESAGTLVAHFLEHENVSRNELDEIRRLIDRRTK